MSHSYGDKGLYASAKRFSVLRSDPAFVEIVRLARVTNALAFAYPPLLITLENQSPSARRDRLTAMLYAGALLHEGLHVAQGLGQHFRHFPQYKSGFAKLLGDKKVGTFRKKVLDKLRDELVFHVDRKSVAAGVMQFPESETLIATMSDKRHGNIYFDFADEVVLGYLYGDAETAEAYVADVESFITQIADMLNRYMAAAHSLIPAALRQMGCKMKPFQRPEPISDDAG
jgi:hypothetical protein